MIAHARSLLASEAWLFAAAALVHAGVVFGGHEHARAAIAEGAIAAVLFFGRIACALLPAWTLAIALATQSVALVATLLGVFAIGITPQSGLDYAFGCVVLLLLVAGLAGLLRSSKA